VAQGCQGGLGSGGPATDERSPHGRTVVRRTHLQCLCSCPPGQGPSGTRRMYRRRMFPAIGGGNMDCQTRTAGRGMTPRPAATSWDCSVRAAAPAGVQAHHLVQRADARDRGLGDQCSADHRQQAGEISIAPAEPRPTETHQRRPTTALSARSAPPTFSLLSAPSAWFQATAPLRGRGARCRGRARVASSSRGHRGCGPERAMPLRSRCSAPSGPVPGSRCCDNARRALPPAA
jgi:hypothetical protein